MKYHDRFVRVYDETLSPFLIRSDHTFFSRFPRQRLISVRFFSIVSYIHAKSVKMCNPTTLNPLRYNFRSIVFRFFVISFRALGNSGQFVPLFHLFIFHAFTQNFVSRRNKIPMWYPFRNNRIAILVSLFEIDRKIREVVNSLNDKARRPSLRFAAIFSRFVFIRLFRSLKPTMASET